MQRALRPPQPSPYAPHTHDKHSRRWRRGRGGGGGRGPMGAMVIWTALVAAVFLLFLSAFIGVDLLTPFHSSPKPTSLAASSTTSTSTTISTTQSKQKKQEQPPQPPAAKTLPQKEKDDQNKDKDKDNEEPTALAAATAAFLERARMDNAGEKKRVQLPTATTAATATESGSTAGDDDDAASMMVALPRVAVLFPPTEAPAALALTKALEAALLEDEEEEPVAVEEVLPSESVGEEDGWLIRVEGDRLAPPADGTTNAAPGPFLLWFTSRVPAYGYGKSHGLSGIIRLLAFPPLRALEAEADVRDYVRWHCRLSHVTAHTPTLTLGIGVRGAEGGGGDDDDDDGTVDWTDRIWAFLGLDSALLPAAQDALVDELLAAGVGGGGVGDGWEALDAEEMELEEEGEEEEDDDEGWRAEAEVDVVDADAEEEEDEEGGLAALLSDAKALEFFSAFVEEVGAMAQWPCGQFEAEELKPACHLTSWVQCSVPWDVCGRATCDGEEGKEEERR